MITDIGGIGFLNDEPSFCIIMPANREGSCLSTIGRSNDNRSGFMSKILRSLSEKTRYCPEMSILPAFPFSLSPPFPFPFPFPPPLPFPFPVMLGSSELPLQANCMALIMSTKRINDFFMVSLSLKLYLQSVFGL